jgi:dihydroflavonol-4-reductase
MSLNQKILVTGGSGLLGSFLIKWLIHVGYTEITSTYQRSLENIPGDLRDAVQWREFVLPGQEASFEIVDGHDIVIHAAGYVSYAKKDKYKLLEINKTGTEHLINAALECGVSHFIYVGSIGALGRETDHVTLDENSPWLDNEFSTAYGLSKYLGELEVWRGAGEGLNVSVVLPSVILGAGDWTKSSLQLVDRIVHNAGWYPGGQTGFVDVRDIVRFIGLLLERGGTGERYLLNGGNLTYAEIYNRFSKQLELNKTFRLAPKWLAKTILTTSNLLKGGNLGTDMLNQAYGTFVYDNAKSLTVDGFGYHPIDDTIRDVALAYTSGKKELEFTPFG